MVGGGALFFELMPDQAILADSNPELINAYIVVRDNVEQLIKRLAQYKNEEAFYYRIRKQNPNRLSRVTRAARLIYLNKTCFNGLYRVNKEGHFNVPFGHRKNPRIVDAANLRAASRALQGIKILHGDYLAILQEHGKPGDLIYVDPPYHPVGAYSDFKRYTKEFFYDEDHIALRDEFARLAALGCHIILTNSNTPFVRTLYEGFDVEALSTRRNISSNPATRTGEDLIIHSSPIIGRRELRDARKRASFLENFPGTRYMGSKYRVLPFLWDCIRDLPFDSVLDAFSGSACVSYLLKQQNKRVVSNDFLHFAHHFAKALIENRDTRLSEVETNNLVSDNGNSNSFIASTFAGMYFSEEDNHFLDVTRANIELLGEPYKRSIALAALSRACMKRRPRGIFTFTGDRYDDGRRDTQLTLKQHFLESVAAFNRAVFDNGKANAAYGLDIFELDVDVDLVYFDPPYFTPKSDNDYSRRYHFVEGLVRQWKGLEIQQHTITKKFKRLDTPFYSRSTVDQAFDALFDKFRHQIIVLSYSSNSLPERSQLEKMLKRHKRTVRIEQTDLTYSFGNQGTRVGNNANRAQEFVFIAE
jgi:DNA adenine methylase